MIEVERSIEVRMDVWSSQAIFFFLSSSPGLWFMITFSSISLHLWQTERQRNVYDNERYRRCSMIFRYVLDTSSTDSNSREQEKVTGGHRSLPERLMHYALIHSNVEHENLCPSTAKTALWLRSSDTSSPGSGYRTNRQWSLFDRIWRRRSSTNRS